MSFFSAIKGRLTIALQVGKKEKNEDAAKMVSFENGRVVEVTNYSPKEDKDRPHPVLVEHHSL